MNGFERLKEQEAELKDNVDYPFIHEIVEYLLTRENMKDQFLAEDKSLKELFEYIELKALSMCIDNKKKIPGTNKQYANTILSKKYVFNWAIQYYNNSKEKVGIEKLKKSLGAVNVVAKIENSKHKETEQKTVKSEVEDINKTKNIDKIQISLFDQKKE